MPDLVSEMEERVIADIDAKLAELQPAKKEYDALMEFRMRVTGSTVPSASTAAKRPSPKAAPRATGRRAAQGTRLDQFIKIVNEHPGITITQAAEAMEVEANYLYRVRDRAKAANRVRHEGSHLFPITMDEPDPARVKELEEAAKGSRASK